MIVLELFPFTSTLNCSTPGCLQAFGMREGTARNVPLLLSHWESLIARKDEIKRYVPAHWNGELTEQGFVDRYNYVKTMNAGIAEAVKEGTNLEDLFAEFDLKTRFPNLDGTPGFTQPFVHNGSLLALWSDRTGSVSAGTALVAKIDESGVTAAVAELMKEHAREPGKYYFLEGELNAIGYRYLAEEKLDEAIAVFEINVDMYPGSWNVYDSLGEAFMKSGRNDLAIANYNKSIELNPDNENGKRMLEQIRSGSGSPHPG